jgi:hypothetical protein
MKIGILFEGTEKYYRNNDDLSNLLYVDQIFSLGFVCYGIPSIYRAKITSKKYQVDELKALMIENKLILRKYYELPCKHI